MLKKDEKALQMLKRSVNKGLRQIQEPDTDPRIKAVQLRLVQGIATRFPDLLDDNQKAQLAVLQSTEYRNNERTLHMQEFIAISILPNGEVITQSLGREFEPLPAPDALAVVYPVHADGTPKFSPEHMAATFEAMADSLRGGSYQFSKPTEGGSDAT